LNARSTTSAEEGRDYAMALLRQVAEQAKANAVLVQQNCVMTEQMTAQQAQLVSQQAIITEQTATISRLADKVGVLSEKVEVLAQAVLTDDEYAQATARATMAGAGQQFAGQVINGLLGGFRPRQAPGFRPQPTPNVNQGYPRPPWQGRRH
jgi:hypothetical protein